MPDFIVAKRNVKNVSCSPYDIPSVEEYFATSFYGILVSSLGALILVVVAFIFVDVLKHVLRNAPAKVKSYTVHVLTIYPVVCFLSYLPLIVPRAYLLSEALIQGIIMVSTYQLFCLFVTYCGGESQLAKQVKDVKLKLNTVPICCCLCCLPSISVSKQTVKSLKWQVLQLPIVQGLSYFIAVVIWMEDPELYESLYWYIQPFVVISLLIGIWGLAMITKLLNDAMDPEYFFEKKMKAMQLIIPITKLQGFVTKSLIKYDVFPCDLPLTPLLYAILLQYSVVLLEIALLSYFALRIYKRELPGLDNRSVQAGGIVSTVFGSTRTRNVNGTDNNGYIA